MKISEKFVFVLFIIVLFPLGILAIIQDAKERRNFEKAAFNQKMENAIIASVDGGLIVYFADSNEKFSYVRDMHSYSGFNYISETVSNKIKAEEERRQKEHDALVENLINATKAFEDGMGKVEEATKEVNSLDKIMNGVFNSDSNNGMKN